MKKIIFISLLFTQLSAFSQIDPNKLSTSIKFDEVISNIERFYVDPVDSKKLTETAIIALLEQLDPHSTYIPAEDADEAQSQINGSFVGIGVRFQIVKDTLMVVEAIPGGPSEKIGVLAGDKIVLVDQLNIAGIGLKNNEVRSKLMGELGTKVTIGILRKNVPKQLDFTIVRDKIPIHSVDAHYMLTPEIGYIKLSIFSRTTVEEVQESIKELKKAGMKQLIFDLQGNGGGLLDAAHRLADEFLSEDKLIVYSEGRTQPRSNLRAGKKGLWEKGDLIILTDEYAASASEILSGALQDWDRALIVGRRTFGKGLVQIEMDLGDGSAVRLTTARYYTPTGRSIQKPYAKNGNENYYKDYQQRVFSGELLSKDSIKTIDSLQFKTPKGKIVYGGGGIIPDVFVAIDTSSYLSGFYFNSINDFAFNFVDNNRASLGKWTLNAFISDFDADETILETYLTGQKIEKKSSFKTRQRIKKYLKAAIANSLFGDLGFYRILHQDDKMLQKVATLETSD